MIDPKAFEELSRKLAELVPPPLKNAQEDMQKQFAIVLQGVFNKLDLVTREEFDIQSQVLAKTRDKLEQMETRLKALEDKLEQTKDA
ncbi:MAG: hypothetical protein CMF25_08450 [Kangiellaceae bacterium]|jgi:BMFP domain-containing protein YqiC|nr:hypothetical protein [Kangiellaceae bacterium]|tara:strand:+ start:2231 stop:2491 length:261 start_codon:yes stop_codon:yes gene_type:complete